MIFYLIVLHFILYSCLFFNKCTGQFEIKSPIPESRCESNSVKDDAGTGQDRLLMRLWLAMPNSRALPEDHAILWGDVGAGRPRGGIAQPATAIIAGG